MFPAPAGMSPVSRCRSCGPGNVPRTCGDEPVIEVVDKIPFVMFPAPAGMSPSGRADDRLDPHVPRTCGMSPINYDTPLVEGDVPRTCGDEPVVPYEEAMESPCSPHLRG